MQNLTEISEIDIKTWSELIERIMVEETPWPQMLLPTLMVVLFVVGLVGNLLTCIVIYYDNTMHTATNFYLFNLAISDLLVTFAIILEIHEHFGSDYQFLHYSFGEITCKIHFFLVVSLWNNGILTMTALAVERYVAICHPLMLQSTPVWRRVSKVLVFIWVVALAETLPEVWTTRLIQTPKASMCFIVPTRFARVVNGVLAVVTFLIPLAIMTFVYAMIALQINVMQKSTSKGRIFNQRNNKGKVNKLINLSNFYDSLVSALIVYYSVALTVSFLVCWLPFFTIRILIFVWDARRIIEVDEWWTFWYKISSLNNWFSAVLNPLLFSLMSTKFRQSLKALWNKKVKGRPQSLQLHACISKPTIHI